MAGYYRYYYYYYYGYYCYYRFMGVIFVIFSFVRFAGFHLSGTVLDARPNSPTQTTYAATEPDKKLKKVSVSFDR